MTFRIIDERERAEVVIKQLQKTGRFDSKRHSILQPIPIDSADLIIQTIISERPDFVVLGFNLGHSMFNGCHLALSINRCSHSYIIANCEDPNEFSDVKFIVDKIVRYNTQELVQALESLIPCF
ncbi:MAG: hypothetical protein NTU76_00770 [Candidatus Taylorbacteria bacterium]|nr:hypothetical protein [Candidatus Taylorbacteria bacterium]